MEMGSFVMIITPIVLSAFAFFLAYANCRFGLKFYTLLSAEYEPVVSILARISDAVLKSLFVTELLITDEWKFLMVILLAGCLYLLGPLIYQSGLRTFTTPLWSRDLRDIRGILTALSCGLITGLDISIRVGGVLVSVTYAL